MFENLAKVVDSFEGCVFVSLPEECVKAVITPKEHGAERVEIEQYVDYRIAKCDESGSIGRVLDMSYFQCVEIVVGCLA